MVTADSPPAAIALYLARSTLPSGLSATDWVAFDAGQFVDRVLYVTRDITRARITGVLSVLGNGNVPQRWRVVWMQACGDYLSPGSLAAAGVTP